ncbi:MAG TPA: SBBP repeat-containing protein, partial [Bacteroidia bacterium]
MFRAVYKKSIGGLLAVCLSLSISSRAQKSASNFPAFIQNKGQILDQNNQQNKEVLFLYCGKGIKIQLRKSGYSYELFKVQDLPHSNPGQKIQDIQELLKTKISNCRADIDFIGGNPAAEIIAEQQSEGSCNYFTGGKRISDVHSFRKVTYKNIFPNTDIEFIITDDQGAPFKYNIILKPGADIKKVKFLIQGASEITTKRGDLSVSLPMGKIHESIPASYYIDQPAEKEQISFALQNNIVSFTGSYDHSRTFIIDPSTNRVWATYYGGSSLDYCTATGADGMNNAYITGYTLSTSTIATAGTYQSTLSGSFDIYLAKFNSGGVRLWASYFGGSSVEAVYGMFVAPSGTAYLCGDTFSTSNVASAGAHQTVYGGGVDDALLVKFDPSGQLLWSTYYGGLYHDIAVGVVEDSNGNVIISGHTESSTNIATAGSYKTLYYGGFDVFVAKFDSTGIRQWGTYYGELDVEETYAADCDAANNIYITGFTTSSNDIATASGYQTSYSGQQDAFIAKFNPSGTTLLYGTYYGGAGNDQGSAIKVDAFGNVFMTGNTTSLTGISSPGSYQPAIGSADDAFIVRFNSVGIRQWGTYFGGNDVDYIASMIFDSNENLLFCGSTLSTNAISSDQAYQPSLSGINYYDSYFERF